MDDLKEKLAAQEVELKQKNEDADALIQRVGVEQEKVNVLLLLMCICCRYHEYMPTKLKISLLVG